jgi:murein DD-endopeptidase MepM/ murein hydrolase activator NlpD
MVKKFFTSLLVLLLVFAQVTEVFADEVSDRKAELDEVQQKLQQADVQRQKAKAVADDASTRMAEVVAQLTKLQTDISGLQKKSDALQKDIDANTKILNEKKVKMEGRMKIYRKRLREIYIHGQINYLDVLLGAKDFNDFASRMFLLQKIIAGDLELVQTVKREADEIQKRQDQLDKQMAEIKKDRASLEEKKKDAEKAREERAQLLYKANEEKQKKDADYDRLNAISENIKNMLQSLERQSSMPSQGGTGRFIWPVTGPITSYAGWRTHPVFGTTRYHSGIDIAVDSGTAVHACDSGTVVYSGWMGGYGYAVMINHGNGLVSIYGHNSRLLVSEGQGVSKGDVIARSGSTGWSTGPHVHFEVRLHGEVVDPLNYLP